MRGPQATLLTLALLAGCSDEIAPSYVLRMQLVTPVGESPLVGAEAVRLFVQQGDGDVIEQGVPVVDGRFSADVALTDLITPVRVGVEVVGAGALQIGAVAPFVPVEATVVRVPIGFPDSCARVEGMDLPAGAERPAVARHGTFVLVAGGIGPDGPSRDAGYLDLLELETGAFDSLPSPAGASVAAPYGASQSVVLAEATAPLRYDIRSSEMPVLPGNLHDGAGSSSTALGLGALGAVVIGGTGPTGARVAEASFVEPDGTITRVALAAPRANAAAVLLDAGVLVVGGSDPADPWAELLPVGGAGAAIDLTAPEPREDATLVSASDGRRALLVGGLDPASEVRRPTVLFDCAPECAASPGPTWARARTGFTTAQLPTGGALLAGGDGPVGSVDRVSFDDSTAYIEPVGDLETPRARAAAFAIEPGIAFVVGGAGGSGPRADVELCFPRSLAFP